MKGFIIGEKHISEHIFNEKGERVPVTHIKTDSIYLVDIKTPEKNGYFSAVLAIGKTKKAKKSLQGLLKKSGISESLKKFREIRLDNSFEVIEKEGKKGLKIGEKEIFIGSIINPNLFFEKNNLVQVTGVSKGKGFQGVVKRHGFAGFPASHGYPHQRVPGSIGQTTTPGRVFKGMRMAGRMGQETVTIKNLTVCEVKDNEIIIKGVLPGNKKNLLTIVNLSN